MRACAQGHTSLEHLIASQSASIKTHVSNEATTLHQRTREDIINESSRVSQHLSSTLEAMQSSKVDKKDRDRFLDSLKYVGMDARRDHIKDPHKTTFEWVFHSIENDTTTEGDTSDSYSSHGSDCAMQMSSVHSTDGDEVRSPNNDLVLVTTSLLIICRAFIRIHGTTLWNGLAQITHCPTGCLGKLARARARSCYF